jgi:RNA polymerase sigma-70 factor (ECF subfamily)
MRTSRSSQVSGTTSQDSCARRDEPLVAAAQAGCASAFTELCNQHSQRIYRTALAITKNREDAEDVRQESFLKAYLALKSFEGRASFSSWLTRIAINCSLMTLRKKRTRSEVSIGFPGEPGDVDSALIVFRDMSPNPEQIHSSRQRFLRLLSAIDNLAPNLRVVARARVLQERSVSETAELLDISEAAIKSRTLRARVRLASKLTPNSKSLNEVLRHIPNIL